MWKSGKEILTSLFVSALILSNILGTKVISVGNFSIPGGIICYALTCLIADVIGERYGGKQSRKVLMYGFLCQVICSVLIAVTLALPAADTAVGDAFSIALGNSGWFTAASLIAYLLSQAADIAIFHGIRDRLLVKGYKHRWIWNKASTAVGQLTDTAVYIRAKHKANTIANDDLAVHSKSVFSGSRHAIFIYINKKGGIDDSDNN